MLWYSNALSHGFQFFWALTCNFVHDSSTLNLQNWTDDRKRNTIYEQHISEQYQMKLTISL
jgi:hypothetical protein